MRDQVVPVFLDEKSYTSSQYTNVIQGINVAASHINMRPDLISEKSFDSVDFNEIPFAAIVTGISMPFIQKTIASLRAHQRCAVLAGMDSEQFGNDVSCATPSRRVETQQLVNYLHHCNKGNIALVGFGCHSINDNFRYHAAMSAVTAWGKLLHEHDVFLWEQEPNESFDNFLNNHSQYNAVICPNDMIAIHFIDYIKKHGIQVPKDLFVSSFGGSSIGCYHKPSVTSMTMDMLSVGEQAFQVWRFVMKNESAQQTALKITVPSRILIRESTAYLQVDNFDSPVLSPAHQDYFYHKPSIAVLVAIEKCLNQRDNIDMKIIEGIMASKSYEVIADELYISASTLRYRLNKIYADAKAHSRKEFETLIHQNISEGNPFTGVK
jgi:DNA-binding LacI/PurR family transcriptional regulator